LPVPEQTSPALRMTAVSRAYHDGSRLVKVLDDLEMLVMTGEKVAVMGASGSGKSTLLHVAAGMDLPDRGDVQVCGQSIESMPEPDRTRFRARRIGLVFQDYNLVESLSAAENIELVCWLTGTRPEPGQLDALVQKLGLEGLLDRRPDQLSGGQQQRVAIARALIHQPALVLADEPTGSLDQSTAEQVLDVLTETVSELGCALILVTHSDAAAAHCDRILALRQGRLESLSGTGG